jgi:anti-anti-sigma regulatory factor
LRQIALQVQILRLFELSMSRWAFVEVSGVIAVHPAGIYRRERLDMTDSNRSTVVELESDLISRDPEALRQALLSALTAGRPIELVAAGVSRCGTAALQVLLAFVREAARQGIAADLSDASPALREAVRLTGLDSEPALSACLAPR